MAEVTGQVLRFGSVTVHLGEKSGKYPDGNQVLVRGSDTRVAFDTPQVANHIGADFDDVDLVILGHVHEDHMAGLHRVPRAQVQVHEADLAAAQSWAGLSAHYGYSAAVLADLRSRIEAQFHYQPRPDATGYVDGATWALGGGVQVRASTCRATPPATARCWSTTRAWPSSATSTCRALAPITVTPPPAWLIFATRWPRWPSWRRGCGSPRTTAR